MPFGDCVEFIHLTVEGLELNPELPGIRNNYWMVTPILGANWKGGAERLLAGLEKRAVLAYKCSSFVVKTPPSPITTVLEP